MFDTNNPNHTLGESHLLAGILYPVLPLYEDSEVDESTGKTISEGIAWGIDPTIRFRLIDRRGRQYYYCRQWARLRREDQMSSKSSSLCGKGMYTGIPKEIIEKAVWNALESMAIDPEELTGGKPEGKMAFIKKYIARITIDAAGNMVIRVRLEARPEVGCYAGRWINGSTIFQKLRALTGSNIETSIEIITRMEFGDQISRLYDILLTDEL